jgi:hypothetical protein
MRDALADAQAQVRAAREVIAMSKADIDARPSRAGLPYVRIELAGLPARSTAEGDGDDDGAGSSASVGVREPVELRLHMSDERVAQGELVVERIRAFLRHEHQAVHSGRRGLSAQRGRARLPGAGLSGVGISPASSDLTQLRQTPFVQPPMRI